MARSEIRRSKSQGSFLVITQTRYIRSLIQIIIFLLISFPQSGLCERREILRNICDCRCSQLFVFSAGLALKCKKIINRFRLQIVCVALFSSVYETCLSQPEKNKNFEGEKSQNIFGPTTRSETFTGIIDRRTGMEKRRKNFATEATQREFINTQLGARV